MRKRAATNSFTTTTFSYRKHSLAAASGLSWESVSDGERQLADYLSVELDLLILLSCCRRWLWQPEKASRNWKASTSCFDSIEQIRHRIDVDGVALNMKIVTCKYTAESYRMWNVRNSDISMTERKRAASLGRDTPTIIKQSDSGPAGITEALDNHLKGTRLNRVLLSWHFVGCTYFWTQSGVAFKVAELLPSHLRGSLQWNGSNVCTKIATVLL